MEESAWKVFRDLQSNQREPWPANSTIFQFSAIYIRDPTVIWYNFPTSIYNQQFVTSMWSEFATNKLYQRFDITEFASMFWH